MRLIYDIEANGYLKDVTKIWCIVTQNIDTNEFHVFDPDHIDQALYYMETADLLIAHNGQDYDERVLQKLYGWKPREYPRLFDTCIASRVLWSDIGPLDSKMRLPTPYRQKPHSLNSWGARFGVKKFDSPDFTRYSEEMKDYCIRDVEITRKLWDLINKKGYSEQAIALEHKFSKYIDEMMDRGVYFDIEAAQELQYKLTLRKCALDEEIMTAVHHGFMEYYETPKQGLRKMRFKKMNPSSRDMTSRFFIETYGWEPEKLTPTGKPEVDDKVLGSLDYPEAKLFAERLMLQKRLGQVADGKKAWLKLVQEDHRIYGYVNHNGAVTGRCTHSRPNMAQIPRVTSPYGRECRSCFRAGPGFDLVGADAAQLELRLLGHYLARWDGGRYARLLLNEDIHTVHQKAAGLPDRDTAKNFGYAYLYGAGDARLGSLVGGGIQEGKQLRKRFQGNLEGLDPLMEWLKEQDEIIGLDGRKVPIRSKHMALNTLLQCGGAVVMKQATVNYNEQYNHIGFQVISCHDELQSEAEPGSSRQVGEGKVEAIRAVSGQLQLSSEMDGDYKIGATWADTH